MGTHDVSLPPLHSILRLRHLQKCFTVQVIVCSSWIASFTADHIDFIHLRPGKPVSIICCCWFWSAGISTLKDCFRVRHLDGSWCAETLRFCVITPYCLKSAFGGNCLWWPMLETYRVLVLSPKLSTSTAHRPLYQHMLFFGPTLSYCWLNRKPNGTACGHLVAKFLEQTHVSLRDGLPICTTLSAPKL